MTHAVTVSVPDDLYDFLIERVAQVNRHAAVLEGISNAEITVEAAVVECVREWQSQVDPENALKAG